MHTHLKNTFNYKLEGKERDRVKMNEEGSRRNFTVTIPIDQCYVFFFVLLLFPQLLHFSPCFAM